MATETQKQDIFRRWNEKGIVVHRRMTHDIGLAISRALRDYTKEEVFEFMDFYATILEPGVKDDDKKYFWSYRWGLVEFLQRGIRKFDGQEISNYLRKQKVDSPQAIVFKRTV